MSHQLLRIILLGAPAVGKGTLAARILQHYDCEHISPGDILRLHVQQRSPLGRTVQPYLEQGALVPDELVLQCVRSRLQQAHNKSWILDGFPRTLRQAQGLQADKSKSMLDVVFNLLLPDALLVQRAQQRWIHLPTGRTYNATNKAPRKRWLDDVTGEQLSQRVDDQPQVVEQRLRVYHATAAPLFEYYESVGVAVVPLSGEHTEQLWQQVQQWLQRRLKAKRAMKTQESTGV